MEETSNYKLNKPSIKDHSRIMPVIENFKNLEIIINRLITFINDFIVSNEDSLTQEKINDFKSVLIQELNEILLLDDTKEELLNKINELMLEYPLIEKIDEIKRVITDTLNQNFITKNEMNSNYGLKTELNQCKSLEAEGRKKLARALTGKGISTPDDSNYDLISSNIRKLNSSKRNCLFLQDFQEIIVDGEKTYSVTYESDTGGVILFSPSELHKKRNSVDVIVEVDGGEPIHLEPSTSDSPRSPYSLFYPMTTRIGSENSNVGYNAGAIHFNNKIKLTFDAYSNYNAICCFSYYKYKYKEVRNTTLLRKELERIIHPEFYELQSELEINGKGIFNPIAIARGCVTTKIEIYIDDEPPYCYEAYSTAELENAGIENTGSEKYLSVFLDSRTSDIYGNLSNIREGFYFHKRIKIVVYELKASDYLAREIRYQFTPL